MIKAVFLDLYGTLARFHPPREDVQAQACKSLDISVTRNGILRGYFLADKFMDSENAGPVPIALRSAEERQHFLAQYEQVILSGAGLNVDIGFAWKVFQIVQEIPYGLTLFDDVLPALDQLMSKQLTLGVLSNINRDMEELSKELGLASYLSFSVTSGEVGAGKPHSPMFLAALERAGVKPFEAFHVGDSYESDVEGARNVGMYPLLLDRYDLYRDVVDCPRISSLIEITEHLGEPEKFSE